MSYKLQVTSYAFSFLLSVFCLLPSVLFGQVTIGKDEEPKSYSVLELYGQYETGSFGGLRLPQLTTEQRNALSLDPEAPGLMIFNTDTKCIELWNGVEWRSFCEDNYVEISGIKWAKTNVNMPGYFADHSYDAGRFYQWNRRMGWSSTSPMINSSGGTTWDYTNDAGTIWASANDPCPTGWRVPTNAELSILLSAPREWGTLNGVDGYFIGNVEPKLFLPATGNRYFSDGSLNYVGMVGYYWSSTPFSVSSYYLSFSSGFFDVNYNNRAYGFAVRCVAEF